jgi:recombination protein RecR
MILKTKGYSKKLRNSLEQVEQRVHDCPECFNFTDNDIVCYFCADPKRSSRLLCVVEEPSDIDRIEGSGAFHGRYHVLHGSLSPLEGIGPEDLKIAQLLDRIRRSKEGDDPIEEVILALDPDLEGDTTVLYLVEELSSLDVRISRIAHGVPLGSDIDYIDNRTLGRALENRVEL